jgi:two-component system, chemotaxis family, sensor kinase Cph1
LLTTETNSIPSIAPWDTQPDSTKRHGISVSNCDAEPVRTPGCIQAHGALLVLRIADLVILQASENSLGILGFAAEALLDKDVSTIVTGEAHSRLRTILASEPTERNAVFVATLPASNSRAAMDLTVHTIDGVVMLEFEPSNRDSGSVQGTHYYSLIKKTIARLQSVDTMLGFCQTLADEVRNLSGFDRVLVYKFHADFHGEVYAESAKSELAPWLGLHYPADDIPKRGISLPELGFDLCRTLQADWLKWCPW